MAPSQLYKAIHLKETMPKNRLRFYVFWIFLTFCAKNTERSIFFDECANTLYKMYQIRYEIIGRL